MENVIKQAQVLPARYKLRNLLRRNDTLTTMYDLPVFRRRQTNSNFTTQAKQIEYRKINGTVYSHPKIEHDENFAKPGLEERAVDNQSEDYSCRFGFPVWQTPSSDGRPTGVNEILRWIVP